MRQILRQPNQLGLFALLTGTLVFSLSSSPGGRTIASASLSSKPVSDCDHLEDRMTANDKDADQNAACSVTITLKDGQKLTKVFKARVGKQTRRALGAEKASVTTALFIDETCEKCKTGPKQHVRPLDSIRDIRDWAEAQAQSEVAATEAAAAELEAEEQAKVEASSRIDGCAVTADGKPQRMTATKLIACRIGQMDGKDEVTDAEYFAKWVQPELLRLSRSNDPADRELAKSALLAVYQRHANNPVIKEASVQIGNFSAYVTKFEQIANQVDQMPKDAPNRAQLISQLGGLKRQWTYTYEQRRGEMRRQGIEDEGLIENSKILEAALNANYAKYAADAKTGQAAGGQGRTQFGEPQQAPSARTVGQPSPLGARPGVQTPVGPTGGAGAKFDLRVLRPN